MEYVTGRYPEFAARFRAACEHAKAPQGQNELGKWLGVTGTTAWNYRNGEKLPSTARGIEIATRLGVSFEWLMTGRGAMLLEEDSGAPSSFTSKNVADSHLDSLFLASSPSGRSLVERILQLSATGSLSDKSSQALLEFLDSLLGGSTPGDAYERLKKKSRDVSRDPG